MVKKVIKRKPASVLEGEMTARPNMEQGKYGGGGGGSISWGRAAWKKAKQEAPKTLIEKIDDFSAKQAAKSAAKKFKDVKPIEVKKVKSSQLPKRMATKGELRQLRRLKLEKEIRDINRRGGKTIGEEGYSASPNEPTNLSAHVKDRFQKDHPEKIKIYRTKGEIEKITGQSSRLRTAAKNMARKQIGKEKKPDIPKRIKEPQTDYYKKPPLKERLEEFKYAWKMIKRKTDVDDPVKTVNLGNKDVHREVGEAIKDPNKYAEKHGVTDRQILEKGRSLLFPHIVAKEKAMENLDRAQEAGRTKQYDEAKTEEQIKAWNDRIERHRKQMHKKGYKLQGDKE